MLEYAEDDDFFLKMSFVAQLLGGLGAGANSTSSMAILSSYSKAEREKYIGIFELFFGLGLLFGPIFGAFFYSIGGYMMPFITFGKFHLFLTECSLHLPVLLPYHHLRHDQGQQAHQASLDAKLIELQYHPGEGR